MLIAACLFASALIGMVGLVIDAGYLMAQRRQVQNAADAAALAAAHVLLEDESATAAQHAAEGYAEANGFSLEGTNSLDVHIPPVGGEHAGDVNYVEVVLEQASASSFIHVLVPGDLTVRARGVAGIAPYPEDYALVALHETDCSSFEQTGAASVIVVGGGVMVNSECQNNAFDKSGSGDLLVEGSIDVHGGANISGTSGTVSPAPNALVPWTVDDPLAGLPVPSLGAPAPGSPGTAENPLTWTITGGGSYSLEPGTYYGGLEITCSGCTITLSPGVYIMAGGGFTKGATPAIVGDGVTIYLTDCNGAADLSACTGDGAAQPASLTGGGVLDLSPPTSGPYQGVTFWQDIGITTDLSISGDSSLVQGIFYAPGAMLDLGGGADLGVVQLVASKIRLSGNAPIDLEYGAFRIFEAPGVALVE